MTIPALSLHFDLHTLHCTIPPAASHRFGHPYMWLVFFKADGSTITITNEFLADGNVELHFPSGRQGNLGKRSNLVSKQMIAMPDHISEWRTVLHPFRIPYFEEDIPSVCGVAAVMLEANNVSEVGIEAAHQAVAKYARKAAAQIIDELRPTDIQLLNIVPSLQTYFVGKLEQHGSRLIEVVKDAIIGSQSIIQNIQSWWKRDELIGYDFRLFTQYSFSEQIHQPATTHTHTFTLTFHDPRNPERGKWELEGSIVSTPQQQGS